MIDKMVDKIRAGDDIKEYIKNKKRHQAKHINLNSESLDRINQFENFNWGGLTGGLKYRLIDELTVYKQYENDFGVEEGDVVVDLGASLGVFPWQIANKKPSKIICVEPSPEFIPLLKENMNKLNIPYEICEKGIWDSTGEENLFAFDLGGESYNSDIREKKTFPCFRWKEFIKEYNIEKIDYLKFDCEGGEWDVFNNENIWWTKNNIRKISGEFHLNYYNWGEKFKIFNETYLRLFPKHNVYSTDMVDVKKILNNDVDKFINYYKQVIINIDNR